MMRALDQRGFREPLVDRMRAGVPFLGICLGLQALFESSEEAPAERGLGIFPGSIRRFTAARVPQMGWNDLERTRASRLLDGLGDRAVRLFRQQLLCARKSGCVGGGNLRGSLHGCSGARKPERGAVSSGKIGTHGAAHRAQFHRTCWLSESSPAWT